MDSDCPELYLNIAKQKGPISRYELSGTEPLLSSRSLTIQDGHRNREGVQMIYGTGQRCF